MWPFKRRDAADVIPPSNPPAELPQFSKEDYLIVALRRLQIEAREIEERDKVEYEGRIAAAKQTIEQVNQFVAESGLVPALLCLHEALKPNWDSSADEGPFRISEVGEPETTFEGLNRKRRIAFAVDDQRFALEFGEKLDTMDGTFWFGSFCLWHDTHLVLDITLIREARQYDSLDDYRLSSVKVLDSGPWAVAIAGAGTRIRVARARQLLAYQESRLIEQTRHIPGGSRS